MSATPREIVRATLNFDSPSRVARSYAPSDFAHTGPTTPTQATDWQPVGNGRWERTDEWGNLWARIDETSKGECVRGVLTDWEQLDELVLPDYSNATDFESIRAARAADSDKWLIGHLPGFAFNIARKMRKLDEYLADLLLQPEKTHALHDRIDDMLADLIANTGRAGADAIMFPEDWGTQSQTLISPDLWRREFFPRFQRLCGLAHDSGLRVMMHSCGAIGAIVPGLIEAGVDCLQFDQPALHGLDALAGYQENAKITFWCPVDVQRDLPSGDEGRIRQAARDLLDALWQGRGGFIAGFYDGEQAIGVKPAWQQWACDEFAARGVPR
jgi:hypothetical protein